MEKKILVRRSESTATLMHISHSISANTFKLHTAPKALQ